VDLAVAQLRMRLRVDVHLLHQPVVKSDGTIA
jgi:hypothetical protein